MGSWSKKNLPCSSNSHSSSPIKMAAVVKDEGEEEEEEEIQMRIRLEKCYDYNSHVIITSR